MSRDTHAPNFEQSDPAAGVSWIRRAEAEVLLRAIRALRLDGILSEDEYQAKRQRLAGQL